MGYCKGLLLLTGYLFYCQSSLVTSEAAPRLCGTDFKMPGRCFILKDAPRSWSQAKQYCRENLPIKGELGIIGDQMTQDLLASEVQKKGWTESWIGGIVSDRRWSWFTAWKWLAFQGCFRDDASNRDLPTEVKDVTSPALCIEACAGRDFEYAGVQLGQSGELLCHCGQEYGKNGSAYTEGCDNDCPGQTSGGEMINQKCGGQDLQLIYYVEGTRFHHFAPSKFRTHENCVVYDHTRDHQWTEQSCQDERGFICSYIHGESSCRWHNLTWADGACVSIHNISKNYYEAYSYCREHDVILVTVQSEAVNRAILSHLDPAVSYYLLLNAQVLITPKYEFMTGYFNFAPNQPAPVVDQDCFVMRSEDDFKWSTVDCDLQYPFICMLDIEIEITPSLPPSTSSSGTQNVSGSSETVPSGSSFPVTGCTGDCGQTATYIGIGVGAAAFVLVLLIILVFIWSKRRKQAQKHGGHMESDFNHLEDRSSNFPANNCSQPNQGATAGHLQGPHQGKDLSEPLPHRPNSSSEKRYLSMKAPNGDPYDNVKSEHTYEEPDY